MTRAGILTLLLISEIECKAALTDAASLETATTLNDAEGIDVDRAGNARAGLSALWLV